MRPFLRLAIDKNQLAINSASVTARSIFDLVNHRVVELIRFFLLTLLIIFAVSLTLLQLFLFQVDRYKPELEEKISELTSLPIKIGQLKGSMDGIIPSIILSKVDVFSENGLETPVIQLNEVQVGINVLQLFFIGQVLPSSWVIINGAKLTIIRKEDGSFSVNGLSAGNSEQPLWLLKTGSYKLINCEISWLDQLKNKSLVKFNQLDLLIKNNIDRQSHELHLTTRLPEEYGEGVRVSAFLQGSLQNLDAINATVFVDARNIQFTTFLEQFDKELPLAINLSSGSSDIRVWGKWNHSTLTSISADIKANNLLFNKGRKSFQIDKLSTLIKSSFRREAEKDLGWRIDIKDFKLTALEKTWPTATFSFSTNTQLTEFAASIIQLDLQEIAELTNFFAPLEETDQNLLVNLQPKGLFKNTLFFGNKEHNQFAVIGEFEQVSINSTDSYPEIHNLTGSIYGTNDKGMINLNMHSGILFFPSLFKRALPIKDLAGRINWLQQAEALQINSKSLFIDTDDFQSNSDFSLTLPHDEKPIFLDLQSSFNAENTREYIHYCPVKIMDNDLVEWLDNAFPAGKLNKGQLLLYGNLDKFPFVGGEGIFEVNLDLSQVEVDYAPDWPNLTQVKADVFFKNNSLSVDITHAEWNGLIKQGQLSIPSFSDSTHLLLQEKIKGSVANGLKYMQQTPLKSIADNILEYIKPQGLTQINLDLEIPLTVEGEVFLDGVIQFTNKNALTIQALDLEVTDIKGTIELTEKGLSSNSITAQALGYPILLTIESDDLNTTLAIEGETDFLQLKQQFSFLENKLITEQQVEGSFNYLALLELPNENEDDRPVNLNITSSLVGIRLDLPEALEKKTEESKFLELDFELGENELTPLFVNYDDQLKAAINIDAQQSEIHSASIVYGIGDPIYEQNKGIIIKVDQDNFELSQWLVLNGKISKDDSETELELNNLSLTAKQLLWKSTDFGQLELVLNRLDKKWQGDISSPFAHGQFEIPLETLEKEKIQVTLSSLNLSAINSIDISTNNFNSETDIPAFGLVSDHVLWNSVNLGTLSVETEKKPTGINFEIATISSNQHKFSFKGDWTKTGENSVTKLKGNIFSEDMGRLLSELDITNDLINTRADIELELSWEGLPYQYTLNDIEGKIDLRLEKGRISSIEPGMGRILGVVAMDQWIKRLSLNFDDVFKQGLSFNDITGQFNVISGKLTTNDLWVDAIPARISIKGEANLIEKTLNNEILVLPKSSDAIPLAGTIVGGIASMITQVLTDDYKEGYFFGSNYKVTGKWDDLVVTSQPDEDGLFKKTWTGLTDFSWVNNKDKQSKNNNKKNRK